MNKTYLTIISHTNDTPAHPDNGISIAHYHLSLDRVLGSEQKFALLLSSADTSKNPFFSGGCAYVSEDDELFITSNLLQPVDPSQNPIILISKVKLLRNVDGKVNSVTWSKLRPPPNMPMPAGAVAYSYHGAHWGVRYCSQGNLSAPGGIFIMPSGQAPVPVVTNWFGVAFGCLCSSAVHKHNGDDETFWFLDAGCRAFKAGFRKPPTLPAAIWKYDMRTGIRSMSDDVVDPWGIALSPDGRTVYVTDTYPVILGNGLEGEIM